MIWIKLTISYLMNWERFGRKWLWPNWDIILVFSWMDWGNPSKTSVRIAGALAEIQTEHPFNASWDYHQTNLFVHFNNYPNIFYVLVVMVTLFSSFNRAFFAANSATVLACSSVFFIIFSRFVLRQLMAVRQSFSFLANPSISSFALDIFL